MKTGIDLIAEERESQKHKWDAKHDAMHTDGEIAKVAASLSLLHTDLYVADNYQVGEKYEDGWGLAEKYKGDTIKCLTVAGALIAAEIDRLHAIASRSTKGH